MPTPLVLPRFGIAGFAAFFVLVPACEAPDTGDPASFRGAEAPHGLVGTYSMRIADLFDGTSRVSHHLRVGEGLDETIYELRLSDVPPGLEVGATVRIHGSEVDEGIVAVDDVESIAPPPVPNIDPTGRSPRRVAFVMVHFPGTSPNLSVTEARTKVFQGPDSTNVYYGEISFGGESITGDVFGSYEVPEPDGCGQESIALSARRAMQQDGINVGLYEQIMYYFPRRNCEWSGLASVGSPDEPARDSWYNGSSGCVVLAQELGHNYGMMHSKSYTCTDEGGQEVQYGPDCDFSEYGDPFDPMGGGCYHMNVYQKGFMGWLENCNSVTATSNARFNVVPTELPCDGIQALRVPLDGDDEGRFYYLEYRRPLGEYDRSLSSGVLVHVGPEYVPWGSGWGPDPYILDVTPDSRNSGDHRDAILNAGDEFVDYLDRVTIRIVEELPTHAVVEVEFPDGGDGVAPVCMDDTEPAQEGGNYGVLACADEPFPHDVTAPTVTIAYPENEAHFTPGSDFTLVAEAMDDRQVVDVELFVDGTPFYPLSVAPYEWEVIDIPAGRYGFQAVADDGVNWVPSEITWVNITDDPPDGETDGTDGGTGSDAGSGTGVGESATGDAPPDDTDGPADTDTDGEDPGADDDGSSDGGCACRSGPEPGSGSALAALGLFAFARRRRRRLTRTAPSRTWR